MGNHHSHKGIAITLSRLYQAFYDQYECYSISTYTASRSEKSVSKRYPVIPLLRLSILLSQCFIAVFDHLRNTYNGKH
jgi:hypothetical protein